MRQPDELGCERAVAPPDSEVLDLSSVDVCACRSEHSDACVAELRFCPRGVDDRHPSVAPAIRQVIEDPPGDERRDDPRHDHREHGEVGNDGNGAADRDPRSQEHGPADDVQVDGLEPTECHLRMMTRVQVAAPMHNPGPVPQARLKPNPGVPWSDVVMGKLLVHLTHGPEAPTRAALALLVARTALDEGHEVSIFLAGDSVQLLRGAVVDALQGLGTGALREHFDAVLKAGAAVYASGMSSKARGFTAEDSPFAVEMSTPNRLVQLTFEADRVLTY